MKLLCIALTLVFAGPNCAQEFKDYSPRNMQNAWNGMENHKDAHAAYQFYLWGKITAIQLQWWRSQDSEQRRLLMTLMILTHNSDFMDGHIRGYIADCKRFAKEEAALRLKELEQSLRSMSSVSVAILDLIPDDEEADHYVKRLRFYKDKAVSKHGDRYVVVRPLRILPERQNKPTQDNRGGG